MSQAKFAAARELIQEQHYDAARAVLETIDDPKAWAWLEKLDRVNKRKQKRTGFMIGGLVGIVLLVGVVYIVTNRLDATPAEDARLTQLLDAYCNYPIMVFERYCDDRVAAQTEETVISCYAASGNGESLQLFIDCMRLRGMLGQASSSTSFTEGSTLHFNSSTRMPIPTFPPPLWATDSSPQQQEATATQPSQP